MEWSTLVVLVLILMGAVLAPFGIGLLVGRASGRREAVDYLNTRKAQQ